MAPRIDTAPGSVNGFEGDLGRQLATGPHELSCWFGLSYASFLTLPRLLMEAMPAKWQGEMAALLQQYDDAFPNQPDFGTRVQVTQGGRLIPTPYWLINYRRPDLAAIDALRPQPAKESDHGKEAEGKGEDREEALAHVQDSGGSGGVGGQHAGPG